MVYVGVDVGKSKCRAAMMSQEGKITEEFDFKNDSEGISRLASMLTVDDRGCDGVYRSLLAEPVQSFR
jgi:predicted NBD/HSP70 family sugar kinase